MIRSQLKEKSEMRLNKWEYFLSIKYENILLSYDLESSLEAETIFWRLCMILLPSQSGLASADLVQKSGFIKIYCFLTSSEKSKLFALKFVKAFSCKISPKREKAL